MKKPIFYTELSFVMALVIMAFAASFTEKAGFGMSMVVAPAYLLHLKVSQFLPWFSFGMAEFVLQGILVLVTMALVRRFKLSYILSFVTAVLYGLLLDGAMVLIAPLPHDTFAFRVLWYVLGTVFCSFAVSLFFHTYLPPEVYELLVKEVADKWKCNINKVKTAYDCISTAVGIVMSFSFFGFGVFEGVKLGTILCALINGALIGRFSKLLERCFIFKNRLNMAHFFK